MLLPFLETMRYLKLPFYFQRANNVDAGGEQAQAEAEAAVEGRDENAPQAAVAAGQNAENADGNQQVDQAAPAAPVAAAQENQDDPNWQPFEWDRAAEELTWERLFGLDGSLIFLEHVSYFADLIRMFDNAVFLFCRYSG